MMDNNCQHRVSILIPCYNGEQYIDRAFKSILAQTEQGLDVILVDDGSTDQSFALAQSYIPQFEYMGHSLRLFQKENGGAASAIALALKHAQGKYIQLFDIDDELTPVSSRAQADWLDANTDCDVVFANGHLLSERSGIKSPIRLKKKEKRGKRYIFKDLLSGDLNNVPGIYMVRHSILSEFYRSHQFLATRFGQNLQMLMPATINKKAGFISTYGLIYYVHVGSHSHPIEEMKFEENLKGFRHIRLTLLEALQATSPENLKLIERGFLHHMMNFAETRGDITSFNQHYNSLKQIGYNKFEDRVKFHNINQTIMRFPYNLMNALKYKLNKLITPV